MYYYSMIMIIGNRSLCVIMIRCICLRVTITVMYDNDRQKKFRYYNEKKFRYYNVRPTKNNLRK